MSSPACHQVTSKCEVISYDSFCVGLILKIFLHLVKQLPEFCNQDSSLIVKEIFGVTE